MRWPQDAAGWPLRNHSKIIPAKPHQWHVQISGEGPDLLLIHGAGGASQSWRNLFPLLAQTHRVITVDLPGQGFTIAGPGRYSLDAMAQDLGFLISQEGWEPMAIIGHSAGAAIALRMTEAPGRGRSPAIIGINAALASFDGIAGFLFPALAKLMALNPLSAVMFSAGVTDRQIQRLLSGTGSKIDDEGVALYRRLASNRAHVDATLRMMAAWNLSGLLARLKDHPAKVFLIAGEHDRTVSPHVSQKTAKLLPHGQSILMPRLGHLAHEEAPGQVHREIMAAIGQI